MNSSPARALRLVLFLVALAAGPAPAWARAVGKPAPDRPSTGAAAARLLGQRGSLALQAGDFAAAESALSQAYRLDPRPETLYQLGQAAWNSGRKVAAQDLLRRFLAEPGTPKDAAVLGEARRILAEPRPPAAELTLIGPRHALCLVDDRVVAVLPLPLPLLVASGEHTVTLEDKNRRLTGRVKVLPGHTAELRFNFLSDAVVVRIVPVVIWLPRILGLPAPVPAVLTGGLAAMVQQQRLQVVPAATALLRRPTLDSCLDTLACQDQLAAATEADYVLIARVNKSGSSGRGSWTLQLDLVEASTGDYAARRERLCADCSDEQLGALFTTELGQLWEEGSARSSGTLEVLSDPPGATVLLAGRPRGLTPYQRPTWAGRYVVGVQLAGYEPATASVVVEEEKKASLYVALAREVEPAPAALASPPTPPVLVAAVPAQRSGRRPRWRLVLGAAALVAGVVLGSFGISAWADNGRCGPTCFTHLDTRVPSSGLLTAAALLTVGGGVLLALPAARVAPARAKGSTP